MKRFIMLIGSNGGLTGVYLAKNLREMECLTIYGADCSEVAVGKFFVDKQFILPNADCPEFIESLADLLQKERIDIYLPTNSKEIKAIARNEHILRQKTVSRFIVSPIETFEALDDKEKANRIMRQNGLPVPEMIDGLTDAYPIIMKRKIGSGGNGTILIENEKIHRAYLESKENVAFFRIVKGIEYTADCLFDEEGNLIGYNQRQRLKMIGGAVYVTRNDSEFQIEPWLKIMADNWLFRGCVNFQYIVDQGIPYFIDINLRYPSGGLPLTVKSGFDIPKYVVKMLSGEKVSPYVKRSGKERLTMYRYFEEIFEE